MEKREYVLGLDLGTSSIGWAVIEQVGGYPVSVLDAGASVFPAGKSSVRGVEKTNNEDRRSHRQARRQLARRRLRKQHLLRVLIDKGMCPLTQSELDGWMKWDSSIPPEERRVFPSSARFNEWLAQDPYLLRAQAIVKPLVDDPRGGFTAREKLGRILYAIIQHRGFLSSRVGKKEGKIYSSTMEKDGKTGIDETRVELKGRTLGQYLYSIAPKSGDPFDSPQERVRSRYTLREMYVDEFDRIWSIQAKPLGLDDESITTTHYRYSKGSPDNRENSQRLARYRAKDPYARVEQLEDNQLRFVYTTTDSLREQLAGKIWRDKEGHLRFFSKDSTLFWQRPLRSQKGLRDKCIYESYKVQDPKTNRFITYGPSVVSISHPYFEVFRALQTIHNIRIRGEKPDTLLLQPILELLLSRDRSIKLIDLKNRLKLNAEVDYPDDFEFPGCPTIAGISKIVKSPKRSLSVRDSLARLVLPFDLDLYIRIWEKLFFFDDNHLLAENLKGLQDVTFVDDLEEMLSKISLSEDFSNVSLHALRNIVPYMLRGEELYEAVLLGGVRNAVKNDALVDKYDDKLREKIHSYGALKRGEMVDEVVAYLQNPDGPFHLKMPEYKLRRLLYHPSQSTEEHRIQDLLPPVETLRNPLVEQALWAMRRQVNYLLDYYRAHLAPDFRFSEIHVELARDLKSSVKGRTLMRQRQLENKEVNDRARDALRGLGLRPSRENIQKYRLYKEISDRNKGIVCCPYTGRTIKGLTDALGSQSSLQIEHIVPRTVTYDDSLANKTLCDADFNRRKGNLTPWQYYQKNPSPKEWGADSWEEISGRAFALLPYQKAKKFVNKDIPDQLSGDQLVDTAYISRKAEEYLTYICDPDNIRIFPGSVTAQLRHLWGLNGILNDDLKISPEQISEQMDKGAISSTSIIVVGNKKTHKPVRMLPKFSPRPSREEGDLILLVRHSKGIFYTPENQELAIDWTPTETLEDGMYYLVLKDTHLVRLEKVFAEKPRLDTHLMRVKVVVDNKGKLSSSELDVRPFKDLTIPERSGSYWMTLSLKEVPEVKRENPRTKLGKGQIKVTGSVKDGTFRSKVYRLDHLPLSDGVAQVILTPDQESALFTRVKLDAPSLDYGEVAVTGAVDQYEQFICDQDEAVHLRVDTFGEVGKFYAVMSFDPNSSYIEHYYTQPPKLAKDEILLEGDIVWNAADQRAYFSPAKNRDDHRHHALDAIVIACTTQSMLTKMSTYNAHLDDYERGTAARAGSESPSFASPWNTFRQDVARSIESILVKHKQDNKVLNKVTKSVYKDGRKHRSEGLALRGELHKETFYGLRQSPYESSPVMHYRVAIEDINTPKLVGQVVDPVIRNLMKNRLQEMGVDTTKDSYSVPKNAFRDSEGNYTIFLPNRRGLPVPVKKVRRSKVINGSIRIGEYNKEVEAQNNHHVLIYENLSGEIKESVVTFWEVADRQLQRQPEIQLPVDGRLIIDCLRKDDMFVIGLTQTDLEAAIASENYDLISKYLYRVQKISSMYYVFRHHSASTLNHEEEGINVQSFGIFRGDTPPIAVDIDPMGHISIYAPRL